MTASIRSLIIVFAALVGGATNTALAEGLPVNAVAVRGYDVVAYFTDSEAVQGSNDFYAVHDGLVYLFNNGEHRTAFIEDPVRYLPAFGGYCAMGMVFSKKVQIDPEAWHIEDGKLYLNLSKAVQAHWRKDVPGNISKAEGNWAKVQNVSPEDL